ncbi:hypothetical protein T484DRAFT_1817931 [Baffinella frigidus]|nr:hypothetical protein T484DRAFT_1817931 [Cryptophyta sp. CCMP2293]
MVPRIAGALDAALSTLPEPILHPALVGRILASDARHHHARNNDTRHTDVGAVLEALAADPEDGRGVMLVQTLFVLWSAASSGSADAASLARRWAPSMCGRGGGGREGEGGPSMDDCIRAVELLIEGADAVFVEEGSLFSLAWLDGDAVFVEEGSLFSLAWLDGGNSVGTYDAVVVEEGSLFSLAWLDGGGSSAAASDVGGAEDAWGEHGNLLVGLGDPEPEGGEAEAGEGVV